jgi:hypothetical protein
MSAGWFALAGVLIGGLLNGWVSYLLGRSSLRADARAAALLVAEELNVSSGRMLDLADRPEWRTLSDANFFGRRVCWEGNRATLGHALSTDGYLEVAAAYQGLSDIVARAKEKKPDDGFSEDENEGVGDAWLRTGRALCHLELLLVAPSPLRPIARTRWLRDKGKARKYIAREETALLARPDYADFIEKYGLRSQMEKYQVRVASDKAGRG